MRSCCRSALRARPRIHVPGSIWDLGFQTGQPICAQSSVLSSHEVGQFNDRDIPVLSQRKQMLVSRHNQVGLGKECTFQDSIVRLIFENMNVRLGLDDCGGFADGAEELLDLVV